ncbi:HYR domain-containing protein, partial [Hyunsoonleella sp. 2307UL5-6]|uniref:HYR domain-containing protein n=1 Tax=Hyunsoonleella sp. 2307UL5-6 TaxID=3384768 RepID=UPI0039BCF4F4
NTFEVTDAAGNSTICSFDVIVTDNEDPTITCPDPINVNVDAGTDGAVVTYTAPVGTDNNASGTVTTTQIAGLPSGSLFPVGTTTNTFEVTDAAGNTTTCSFDVIVTDNEDPTITCPNPINVNIDTGVCGAIVTYTTPVGTDNSNGVITTQISGLPSGSLFPVGTTTNTFEVADTSGNTITCSFDVIVIDNEDPTITCPADITANTSDDATGNCLTTVNLGTPTTNDNCTVASVVAQVNGVDIDPTTFEFPLGDTTVTWFVTDDSGNTADCTQMVTIIDNEDPTITCPADITANTADDATGNCLTTVDLGTPTTADNCTVASVVAQVNGVDIDPTTFEFPLGDTTITWIVTDGSDNTAECTQIVTIIDNEDPTITCPEDITANTADDATGNCLTTVDLGTPTTADNCTVASVVAQVNGVDIDPTTFEFPLGDTTVTWIVTDGSDNTAECTQTVTIVDNEDPTITCPADITANTSDDATGNCLTTVNLGTPTTNDNCTVASVVAQVNGVDIDPATFEFPLGDTTVTWIVTDGSDNTAECTQTITVLDDENPTITCPDDITVNADAGLCSASNVDLGEPVTNDNCAVASVLNNALEPFALGETIVTWTVTDESGNTATCEQTITVVDGELPELVCPPALTVNVDPGTCEATNVSLGDLNVEDCTDVIISNDAPSTFPIGETTVIWTATDLAGNSQTCEQLVTVIDNIPPTFEEPLPTDVTVECDAIPAQETLTATDNCSDDIDVDIVFNEVRIDGSCVSNYILERTWTATDEADNTTTHTQIITVEDTTPPLFVERLPVDITVECDAIPTPENITATDNCSTASVTTEDVIIEGECVGTYTLERTYTATDACGLTATYTQTINVQDTTAPAPLEAIEETITVSCTDIPEVPEIQFQDNCSTDIIEVFNEVNGFDDTVFEDYQIIRTWTVRDACNNEETYTQTLNVMLDEIITQVNGPDRCYNDGIIDLNEFLTSENKEGTWELLEGDTDAELNDNLFNPTTLEPSLDFLPNNGDSIEYIFRYTGLADGCINITEVNMSINPDCVVLPCGDSDIDISKALTPNGDGFNDSFDIMGIELCGFTANVKIFNRWGALIFESSNYTLGAGQGSWQGNSHKSSVGSSGTVPNGTYYYIINLEESGLPPYTGPIYIGTK